MKVRTEARRDAIVREATQLFLEMGYERATMGELTQRMGGSKATLYGYFSSKEQLFAAVVEATGEAHLAEAVTELDALPVAGLEAGLIRFAERMISLMTRDEAVALRRMIVGEAGRSEVGEVFIQLGPRRCLEAVSAALAAAMDRGELARGSPQALTMQLLGLVRAELDLRDYLRRPPRLTRRQVAAMAGRAVRMFIGGHRYASQEAVDDGERA